MPPVIGNSASTTGRMAPLRAGCACRRWITWRVSSIDSRGLASSSCWKASLPSRTKTESRSATTVAERGWSV